MAETPQQKSERVRKQRERSRAGRIAQTASDRQATLQLKNTCERKRMAGKTPTEKEARLQRIKDRLEWELRQSDQLKQHDKNYFK